MPYDSWHSAKTTWKLFETYRASRQPASSIHCCLLERIAKWRNENNRMRIFVIPFRNNFIKQHIKSWPQKQFFFPLGKFLTIFDEAVWPFSGTKSNEKRHFNDILVSSVFGVVLRNENRLFEPCIWVASIFRTMFRIFRNADSPADACRHALKATHDCQLLRPLHRIYTSFENQCLFKSFDFVLCFLRKRRISSRMRTSVRRIPYNIFTTCNRRGTSFILHMRIGSWRMNTIISNAFWRLERRASQSIE